MSMLSEAVSLHLDTLGQAAGESITYVRGDASRTLTAIPGQARFETIDQNGAVVEIVTHTFVMRQDDLVLNGATATPERNDLIRYAVNGVVGEYRVLQDQILPHYRVTDSFGKGYRVFTKKV